MSGKGIRGVQLGERAGALGPNGDDDRPTGLAPVGPGRHARHRWSAQERLSLFLTELRTAAEVYFRGQPRPHLLQPTALVHEVVLKLVQAGRLDRDGCCDAPANVDEPTWQAQLRALASRAMRQVLVDHARARMRIKRGGNQQCVQLSPDIAARTTLSAEELLMLDEAIVRLAAFDPRCAQVVELRFFGGMTIQDTARVLEVSDWTVEEDWRVARAWLAKELSDEAAGTS
ncbi:MAG: ECF-type sigma factor [Phycisphaerales bacterium]